MSKTINIFFTLLFVLDQFIARGIVLLFNQDAYYRFHVSVEIRLFIFSLGMCVLMFHKPHLAIKGISILWALLSFTDVISYINTGNVDFPYVSYALIGAYIIWVCKKLPSWVHQKVRIPQNDTDHVYIIYKPSETFYGTILSLFGKDIENVSYYAYDTYFHFTKDTSRFTASQIKINPNYCIKKKCDSLRFKNTIQSQEGSKYDTISNNCESVARDAKVICGLKYSWFPQFSN